MTSHNKRASPRALGTVTHTSLGEAAGRAQTQRRALPGRPPGRWDRRACACGWGRRASEAQRAPVALGRGRARALGTPPSLTATRPGADSWGGRPRRASRWGPGRGGRVLRSPPPCSAQTVSLPRHPASPAVELLGNKGQFLWLPRTAVSFGSSNNRLLTALEAGSLGRGFGAGHAPRGAAPCCHFLLLPLTLLPPSVKSLVIPSPLPGCPG